MRNLTRFAIENGRFTWLIVLALLVGGVSVYFTQPRQEDPELVIRSAQVVTQVPGLSPERIEQLVTRPIEDAIKSISQVETINSLSTTGLSIVTPEAADRYTDMAPIWSKLRNKMDDLGPSLPQGAIGPRVNDDFGRVAVITLALTGSEYSMAELHSVAKDIRDELSALPLVATVDLYGVQEERIWLEFDAAFMAQFGVTPREVVSALQAQNVVLPGGSVNADGQNVVIESSGDFRSIEDIRHLAVTTGEGRLVYLADLAEIRRGYVDPPQSPSFYNGQPAIVIGLSMVGSSNVVELGEQVMGSIRELRGGLPLGMDLDVAIYQPDLVQAAVNSATSNLLQTVLVVLLVVMLALGLRTGLIVGAMVPLTMMATLIGMSVWGIELHRVSIAAIIVALGLLVDNGVVIAEDIKKRLDLGAERLEASLATPQSLAVPLLTSSLTTVAAFMPLVLISGGSGEFLRSLGQVLALALLSSWLIAITVIPAFCYWFLPKSSGAPGQGNAAPEESFDSLPYRVYQRLIEWVLRVRLLFIGVMGLLLVSSVVILGQVKKRSLGPSERNQFTVYLDLPSEATIGSTMAATQRLVEYLRDESSNPEVVDVLSYVGHGGPRFFLGLSPNDPQPNKAFLIVNTQEPAQIYDVMPRVDRFLVEEIPEGSGRTDILFLGSAPLGTVDMKIAGDEIDVLRHLGSEVQSAYHAVPGVQSIRNNWENSVIKLQVEIDQERARRAGVTSEGVANALSAYFDGANVTTYREGESTIPVTIRAREEDRAELDRVRSLEVISSTTGKPVPLLQIADFRGVAESSRIRRVDQERSLTVLGKHPDMTAEELYAVLQPQLAGIDVPPGYTLEVDGEIKDSAESNADLFEYAPHALLAILMLLVLQFNSFRRPAIILMTIPLVLIGANYGLYAFDGYFDFTAMLGLFSLAGIIINNGIVLIDRIDEGRKEGLGVSEAVIHAALARARPIIMTTITTVVGLIPLALFGGEFWYGMAIVIMCGLGVGTFLTLGFVPVMYSLLFEFRRARA